MDPKTLETKPHTFDIRRHDLSYTGEKLCALFVMECSLRQLVTSYKSLIHLKPYIDEPRS